MGEKSVLSQLATTVFSLAFGAVGAALAYWLSFPVFILTGPAILVALVSLMGVRFGIYPPIWNAALLSIGIGIGAGVNSQATEAFLRWPLAFAALGVMLVVIMAGSRAVLMRFFGLDQNTAVLASTPGHLSFVLSLGASLTSNVAQISTVQSVRLLALTLLVPFTAQLFGMDLSQSVLRPGSQMAWGHLLILVPLGALLGLILKRFKVPAPFLIGGLLVSTVSHVTEMTPGILTPWIALPGFLAVGTMIGSRFSGTDIASLRKNGLAGLAITAFALCAAALAAWPVSQFLGLPISHVLVAFAPGGLETMVTVGFALGADPGFIAAAHVARLLMLLLILPVMLGRRTKSLH